MLAVRLTVYRPTLLKRICGFCVLALLPPAKFQPDAGLTDQAQEVGIPIDKSVKLTEVPGVMLVALAEKLAVGATGVVGVQGSAEPPKTNTFRLAGSSHGLSCSIAVVPLLAQWKAILPYWSGAESAVQ